MESNTTEKMQKCITPKFSNEIVSQLSQASLICEGIEASLIALDSNLRHERMSPDLVSAMIMLLTRQIAEVNAAITEACRSDAGATA